jgi:hypothetical protein
MFDGSAFGIILTTTVGEIDYYLESLPLSLCTHIYLQPKITVLRSEHDLGPGLGTAGP